MIVDDIIAKFRASPASGTSFDFDFNKWMEESLGLPSKLFDSLSTGDDWTFIMKVHGIIEAGLNHMLLMRLGKPTLSSVVSKLATGDSRTGKLAFVKALDLLPDNARAFIGVLSTIRNKAAHNAANFDLSITEYVKTLKSEDRRNWKRGLSLGLAEGESPDTVISNPRGAIRGACMIVMGNVLKHELVATMEREIQTVMRVGIEELANVSAPKRKKKRRKANGKKG